MNAVKTLLAAAILTLAPIVSSADIVVSYFEPLQKLHVSESSLRFDAMGRSFEFQIETNERVLAGLSLVDRIGGIGVHRGKLANQPGSWARIVVFDGMPRGVFWDGSEMFAIEVPGDSGLPISAPVIYRLADSYIVPGTMRCGIHDLAGNTAAAIKGINAANKAAIARAPGAVSEITMGAIGDYEFTTAKGGDAAAAAAITARLNNVDGFFSEQVGVQINVQLIETHSDINDPFSDTLDAGTLLDDLSTYRLQSPSHNAYGATHLYTGRDLDGSTVGIAWRGALCDDFLSAGLSEGRGSALFDSLIAAHEIGHNFNAQHDGEAGTPCEADTSPYIMSPSINGSQTYSDCSIAIMQAEAASASCVVALPTIDVGIRPVNEVSTVLLGASADFEYVVSSNGTVGVSAVVADFVLPNTLTVNSVSATSGSCTSGAGTASCDFGDMPGLTSYTITIATTPSSVGMGTIIASVSTTDTDERPSNNQHVQQLSVNSAVDLVVNTPGTAAVFVNDTTTVNATLDNVSMLDATGVVMSITLENGLQASSASWSIGSCTVSAQQIDCQAANFAAQSSSTLSVTATAVTSGNKDVTVTLTSNEAEANPGDNTAVGEVRVVTPNDGKDESGSGAINPLLLLMFASAIAIRSRRYC